MNKYFFAVPIVLGLALAGCNQTEAPETQAGGQAAAPASPAERPVASQSNRNTIAIGGGVALPRGYTVRSRSTSGEGAEASHVVRAEFKGTPDAAGDALRKSLANAGFKQTSVSEGGDASVTRIFRSVNQRVRVVFLPKGPSLQVELQYPDSGGLATFYWQDPPISN